MKCDGTRAETRFRLSAKRTSPFKSAGTSVQSTTGSRGVRISGSNAGFTMLQGSVKSTGCPLHSQVSCHFLSRVSPCAVKFQLVSTLSLTLAFDGGGWLAIRADHFTKRKDTRYPLYRRRVGPQGKCGWLRKISTSHRDSITGPTSP